MKLYITTSIILYLLLTTTACSMNDVAVYLKCGTVNTDIPRNPDTCEGQTKILVEEVEKTVRPDPTIEYR